MPKRVVLRSPMPQLRVSEAVLSEPADHMIAVEVDEVQHFLSCPSVIFYFAVRPNLVPPQFIRGVLPVLLMALPGPQRVPEDRDLCGDCRRSDTIWSV